MEGWSEDLYFKKRIEYAINRQRFRFDAGELLFSTHDIDAGTQLLLRFALPAAGDPRDVLDLGCGYGVIGVTLARFHPAARVLMVDQDLLAVRYAAHNASLNGCGNAEARPGIGVDGLERERFDMILSNVPGHIGEAAISRDFVARPAALLRPGGSYWLVIVTPLAAVIEAAAAGAGVPWLAVARRPQHVVFRLGDGAAQLESGLPSQAS